LVIVGLLFILALPINAFWYTLFMLVLRRLGRLDFAPPGTPKARALRRKVAIAVVLMTLVSCTLDVLWSDTEPFWMAETQEPLLKMLIVLASSVVLMSVAVVRLEVATSAIIATGLVVVTIVQSLVVASVFYSGGAYGNPTPSVIAYGVACAFLSVFLFRAIGKVGGAPSQREGPQRQIETEARQN